MKTTILMLPAGQLPLGPAILYGAGVLLALIVFITVIVLDMTRARRQRRREMGMNPEIHNQRAKIKSFLARNKA